MPFLAISSILLRLGILLWVAPLTVVGLLLALPVRIQRGHWRLVRRRRSTLLPPALLVHGPIADWVLRRHPAGAMNAMALGHIVIASRGGLTPRVLTHELEHVRQAERWGPLFPFAYLGSSGWQLLNGRNAYWHNHFEIAARAAETRG